MHTEKKASGPNTPAGKQISSQNSFKTGLYATSLIIQGEKPENFETLQNEYYERHQPQSPEERDTLDNIIRLVWQLRRYAHVESELWDWEVYEQTSSGVISRQYPLGDMFAHAGDKFSRLQRMQAAAQRNFKDALHELERLKASRPDPEFVSSTSEPAPSQPPIPGPQPPHDPEFVSSTSEPASSQPPVPGPQPPHDPEFVSSTSGPAPSQPEVPSPQPPHAPDPQPAACYHPNDGLQSNPLEQRSATHRRGF